MVLAAVCQLTSTPHIAHNAQTAVQLISRAARAGAAAVFLPEATDFITAPPAPSASAPTRSAAPTSTIAKTAAELTRSEENRAFFRSVREAAQREGVMVSVGVHEDPDAPLPAPGTPFPSSAEGEGEGKGVEKEGDAGKKESGKPGRCYNTQMLIGADGTILERYRKLHLFDVDIKGGLKILESNSTIPGTELPSIVSSPIGRIGALTCYDIRFPEASLALRKRGAQILTYPSAFTVRTGAAHWEVLLRARAIETQCYVLAAAQVGVHVEGNTQRVSWGHAMVVDPFGSVIAQCSDMQPYQPTFCLADIDLDALEKVRLEMPLWDQRRYSVYPEIG